MAFYYRDSKSYPKWKDYTLILPSVAVGNVGQLAVDLILTHVSVSHAGYLHDNSFLPIIGADPFNLNSPPLTTSCQFYVCDEKKLVILQQRSPIVPGKFKKYITLIINWIQKHQFKKTILLTSSFSQFFTINDLEGVPLHFLHTTNAQHEEKALLDLKWKKFFIPSKENTDTFSIPGGGIAKLFLEECEKESIPLIVLILVCSEGNNYPEAFQMVDCLNNWLTLKDDYKKTWELPISWMLPYGNDPPSSIY